MKNNYISVLFLLFLLCPYVLTAQLSVKADRATAKYAIGDTAYFIAQSATDGMATYSIKYAIGSDLPPLSTGSVHINNGYAFIPYVSTSAEVVHCAVTQNGQTNYAAAAFDALHIQPVETEAPDFDAFWAQQKATLAAIPLNTNVTFRSRTSFADRYNFDIGLTDGKRAYGYINVPRGNGAYPAIIELPGFGTVPNIVNDNEMLAERAGVISVALNVHNNLPSQQGPHNYLDNNINNPNNYYLKYVFLSVIKTIDYLQTRPDFNGQVGIIGLSQGGGLALLAAGIDNRISLLVNAFSAFCEHPALKYGKPSGFPSYWRLAQSNNLDPNAVLNTVKYYDAVTAAKRFKGVSWTMIGYRDEVCAPSTIYKAYNQLKGQKILTHALDRSHQQTPRDYSTPDGLTGFYSFFRRHFPATKNAPWPWGNQTIGYTIDVGQDIVLEADKNTVLLRGSIELEYAPTTHLAVQWEKIEGAGTVIFANPTALTTQATFSQAGTYRLRMIAEDVSKLATDNSYITLSDDIMVTVLAAVPIELMDFKGIATEKGNELSWSTASEKDNKWFELEHSSDSKDWAILTKLAAKGNSTNLTAYQSTDKNPYPISYYRLKQIDMNGDFTYSKIINIKAIKADNIQLFPNPVRHSLTIQLNDNKLPFDVKVYDSLGRICLLNTSNTNELILNTTDLISGHYFIEIKNKELTVIKKFIISKN